MQDDHVPATKQRVCRMPWNKGKLVGAKPPLRPSHVWSIRTKLQIEDRKRDLALFNLAIDSKLRGCDVVAVRVDDVAPNGYAMDRATIRQKKTGRPVRFELTDQTRLAIDEYLRLTGRTPGQFLFAGRGDGSRGLTTRQYARLVQEWVASIGLDPSKFAISASRSMTLLRSQRRSTSDTRRDTPASRRGRRCNSRRRPPAVRSPLLYSEDHRRASSTTFRQTAGDAARPSEGQAAAVATLAMRRLDRAHRSAPSTVSTLRLRVRLRVRRR